MRAALIIVAGIVLAVAAYFTAPSCGPSSLSGPRLGGTFRIIGCP
jgi:hypothetical protein